MTVPVALIHGLGSSYEQGWRRHGWVDLLEEEGRVVIPFDLPGHGSRIESRSPEDYVDIAGQLAARVEQLGPIDVIGFSAGARIALHLAHLDPTRIRRLVLMGAGDSFLAPYDSRPLAAAIAADQPHPDRHLRTFHRLARLPGNSVEGMVAFLSRPDQHFSADMLGTITVPTLVITGGSDRLGDAARLRSALPDSTHVEIPACDHFTLPSDPRVMEAALAFVAR